MIIWGNWANILRTCVVQRHLDVSFLLVIFIKQDFSFTPVTESSELHCFDHNF